jgi:hypothetical protein
VKIKTKTVTVKQLEREQRKLRNELMRGPRGPGDTETLARLAEITHEIVRVQATHTPGPWLAREYANDEGGVWIDCDAWTGDKRRGTAVAGTLATAHKSGTGDGNVGANARLIAAAPELLAALEAVIDTANSAGGIPNPFVVEQARKIIAKARAPWKDGSK